MAHFTIFKKNLENVIYIFIYIGTDICKLNLEMSFSINFLCNEFRDLHVSMTIQFLHLY